MPMENLITYLSSIISFDRIQHEIINSCYTSNNVIILEFRFF